MENNLKKELVKYDPRFGRSNSVIAIGEEAITLFDELTKEYQGYVTDDGCHIEGRVRDEDSGCFYYIGYYLRNGIWFDW